MRVPDLLESSPGERHYVLDDITGKIVFGGGRRGLAPAKGDRNIRVRRHACLGEKGRVAAGAIVTPLRKVEGIESISNPAPARGGADRETLDRAKARAARLLHHANRAVTASDYEDLAKAASAEVARAHCMRSAERLGEAVVFVVPQSEEACPTPSARLLRTVHEYLDERRPIAARVRVASPVYVPVKVELRVILEPAAERGPARDDIWRRIADEVVHYYHPLHGGEDGRGWAFGENVYSSSLYKLVERVKGVERTWSVELNGDPRRILVPIEDGELVAVDVVVRRATWDEPKAGVSG
jgi:predicted phage baseplate assembly protein